MKLFNQEETVIRTVEKNGKLWFNACEVYKVLDMTWKGAAFIEKKGISKDCIIKVPTLTDGGGTQKIIYIDTVSVIKLVFRSKNSVDANKFADWTAEYLLKNNDTQLCKPFLTQMMSK
jgi:prophage antirepressor-like protein